MTRATWAIVLASVLVLGIGIGAGVGLAYGPAPLGSNGHLRASVYPAIATSNFAVGKPLTGMTLSTTTGDVLVAIVSAVSTLSNLNAHGGAWVNSVSDAVDGWTNVSFAGWGPISGFVGSHTVWTATAATTGTVTFSAGDGSGFFETGLTVYDLTPLGGYSLSAVSSYLDPGTGHITMSETTSSPALLLSEEDGLGAYTPPGSWTAIGTQSGSLLVVQGEYLDVASSGTTSGTWTGGSGLGEGLLLAYESPSPMPATAPSGLVATSISGTEIDLSWTNPSGESLTDSLVNQSVGAGCSSPTPIDLGSVSTSYAATGLAPATEFSFEVTASNATGFGPPSACVTAYTLYPTPPAPTNVVVSTEPLSPPHDYGLTRIDVTWTASSGGGLIGTNVSVFADDCSTPVAGPYPESGSATGATIGSLAAGTSYCFEVSSTTNGGEGAFSTPTSASINTTLPDAPMAVVVTAASTSLFSVGWTDPSGNLTGVYTAEAFVTGVAARKSLARSRSAPEVGEFGGGNSRCVRPAKGSPARPRCAPR